MAAHCIRRIRAAGFGVYFKPLFLKRIADILRALNRPDQQAARQNKSGMKRIRSNRCSQTAFTLLEVMIVVVILGILAALVVPKIISRPDEARVIAAKQDVATLVQALKLYRLDNLRYPTTEQGLQALVEKPASAPLPPNWKPGGYLERLPRDPWGNAYQYLNPGVRGEIDVFSFGADGAPRGEGNDADIGSWNL